MKQIARIAVLLLSAHFTCAQLLAAIPEESCSALLEKGDSYFKLGAGDNPNEIERAAWEESLKNWTAAYPLCLSHSVPPNLRAQSALRWSDVLMQRGNRSEAESVIRTAIDDIESTEGTESVFLVDLLRRLYTVAVLGDGNADTLKIELRVLAIQTKAFGATSEQTAQSEETIGFIYEQMDQPKLAEKWFRKAIESAKGTCPGSCGTLLGAYDALHDLLREQPGREAEAREIQELSDAVSAN